MTIQGATAKTVWEAVCDEAQIVVIRGEKFMLLDEEMTFRIGCALDGEIIAALRNAAPATPEEPPWGSKPPVEVISCGRPAKKLCQGGPECWCKHGESNGSSS